VGPDEQKCSLKAASDRDERQRAARTTRESKTRRPVWTNEVTGGVDWRGERVNEARTSDAKLERADEARESRTIDG
jgi:hypothetical protein